MKGKGRQGGRGSEQATHGRPWVGQAAGGKFEVPHADTSDRQTWAQEDEAREPVGTHGHSRSRLRPAPPEQTASPAGLQSKS